MIRPGATAAEYDDAVRSFLTFVKKFNSAALTAEAVGELRNLETNGRTILLAFNPPKKRVVPVDPLRSREQ